MVNVGYNEIIVKDYEENKVQNNIKTFKEIYTKASASNAEESVLSTVFTAKFFINF
jgi:uncharacterized membrane protein